MTLPTVRLGRWQDVLVGGYELSAALDVLLTGEDGGRQFIGRGSAHRACVEHLQKQGEA